LDVIKRWADTHANLPLGQGGKAMWSLDNQASVNPYLVAGFLLGGFIPTCHARAVAEMTKLEKLYGVEM